MKCGQQLEWFKEWEDVDPAAITVSYEDVEKEEEKSQSDYGSEEESDANAGEETSQEESSEEEDSDYSEGEYYMDDEFM